MQQLFRVLIFF